MIRQIKHWIEKYKFRRTFVASENASDSNVTSNWRAIKIDTPEGKKLLKEQLVELKKARQDMIKEGLFVDAINVTAITWLTHYLLFRHKIK